MSEASAADVDNSQIRIEVTFTHAAYTVSYMTNVIRLLQITTGERATKAKTKQLCGADACMFALYPAMHLMDPQHSLGMCHGIW